MTPIDTCIVAMERACFLARGDLKSSSRLAEICRARHALIFAIRERAEQIGKVDRYPFTVIGRAFERDDATCIHSVRRARSGQLGEVLDLARNIAARYIEE
jgi:chromosomal replication initiation ATPase DnaA